MKLHLGCGTNYKEGWVNVDLDPNVKADWHGDCNEMPFANDTFDYIYTHHVLEHFDDLFKILYEISRVSKNGAILEIIVPYWSWSQNQGNPYHKLYFSEHTMRFFDKENGIYKRGQTQPFSLQELECDFNEQEIHWKLKLIK